MAHALVRRCRERAVVHHQPRRPREADCRTRRTTGMISGDNERCSRGGDRDLLRPAGPDARAMPSASPDTSPDALLTDDCADRAPSSGSLLATAPPGTTPIVIDDDAYYHPGGRIRSIAEATATVTLRHM